MFPKLWSVVKIMKVSASFFFFLLSPVRKFEFSFSSSNSAFGQAGQCNDDIFYFGFDLFKLRMVSVSFNFILHPLSHKKDSQIT